MMVPATDVLEIVQSSLGLIGNPLKLSPNQTFKTFKAIEPSWNKYTTKNYVANDPLCKGYSNLPHQQGGG